MTESLLGRISRYGVSALRDSREDRLTEILAALFDSRHCPGLARQVALGWLERACEQAQLADKAHIIEVRNMLGDSELVWSCLARTQLRISIDGSPRRPDLEVRFRGRTEDGDVKQVSLWVEVKHGTPPHTGQLQAYLDAQRAGRVRNATVVLVAPRGDIESFDANEIPSEVPKLTWQDTAQQVKRYVPADDIGAFLIDELLRYLREEGLMDPEQLTPVHLVALANHREAVIALDRVCEIAAEEVGRRWNDADSSGSYPPRGSRSESWWNYPKHPRGGDTPAKAADWNFDWQLFDDSSYLFKDGRPGVPCFAVGMAAGADKKAAGALDTLTQQLLEDSRFEILPLGSTVTRNFEYAWRRAYPEEVIVGGDIVSQGAALAAWIVDGFTALTAALNDAT